MDEWVKERTNERMNEQTNEEKSGIEATLQGITK